MELLREGFGEELKRLTDAIKTATVPDIAFASQRVACRSEACGSETAQEVFAILIAQAAHLGFPACTRSREERDRRSIMTKMAVSGQTLGMLRRTSGLFQKEWIDALIEMMAKACITAMELERLQGGDLSGALFMGDGFDIGLGIAHGVIALEIYRVGGGEAPRGNAARALGRMILTMVPGIGFGEEERLCDYLKKVWRENGVPWQVQLPPVKLLNQLIAFAKEEIEPVEAPEASTQEPAKPAPARSAAQRPRG